MCKCAQERLCVPHLVFIIEQLGEFWHSTRGKLGVILVVDQMDDGCLEHLRGLSQPLDVGHLGGVCLSQDGGGPFHSLWEHGSSNPLSSCNVLHIY